MKRRRALAGRGGAAAWAEAYLGEPYNGVVSNTVEKLVLPAPRGYCAGVARAVETVEQALEIHGAPVYVRKEIVHNRHVVEQLTERGAIFVEEVTEVPR